MKVLLIGDNHGEQGVVDNVYSQSSGDINIHLGDSEFNYDDTELGHFFRVQGNCDIDQRFPVEEYDKTSNVFLTHGHLYDVKLKRNQLAKRAEEYGAKYAVYGHTHIAYAEKVDGVYCINPGSISLPKGEWESSYAILDTDEDIVTFFNREHAVINNVDLKAL